MKISRQTLDRWMNRTTTFFTEGTFAVFALMALFFFQVFVTVVVFWPPSGSVWGSFAEEFRIRCFQYDPDTGWMLWTQVLMMVFEPILLQVIIGLIWRKQIKEILSKQRRRLFPTTTSALVVVCLVAGTLVGFGRTKPAEPDLAFPGERIRTQLNLPWTPLTNQDGNEIDLNDFKGRVVLITGVYATCTATCPMILDQLRRVIHELSPDELKDLSIIAVSLDPERDTPELRSKTVRQYVGDHDAEMHFVNGPKADVDEVLDRLQITRMLNKDTGQIDHANLFVLLDREGKVAFRLTLSEKHESWLMSAVRLLIQDTAKTGDTAAVQ